MKLSGFALAALLFLLASPSLAAGEGPGEFNPPLQPFTWRTTSGGVALAVYSLAAGAPTDNPAQTDCLGSIATANCSTGHALAWATVSKLRPLILHSMTCWDIGSGTVAGWEVGDTIDVILQKTEDADGGLGTPTWADVTTVPNAVGRLRLDDNGTWWIWDSTAGQSLVYAAGQVHALRIMAEVSTDANASIANRAVGLKLNCLVQGWN